MNDTGSIPNQDFWELKKIGEIEFVLVPFRQEVGDGFIDTLRFDFSRDINSLPERRGVAKALLDLVNYRPFSEDLFYHPLQRVGSPETAFIRQESGVLYASHREDVAKVVNNLFSALDRIVNHPHSLCLNVSLDGLGYFNHAEVRQKGQLFLVDDLLNVPEPGFYASNYPETHPTRRWLSDI